MAIVTIEQVREITARHVIEDYQLEGFGIALPATDTNDLKGCENHIDDQFLSLLQQGAHLDFEKYKF